MLRRRLTLAIGLIALGVSVPALSIRLEYIAQSGGARVAGAEICFFHAGGSRDVPNLYLGSDDVRCVSADDVIDLPAGNWAYFLRHSDGLVSIYPGHANVGPGSEERGYKQVFCEMRSAATIDVAALRAGLAADESLAVYLSYGGEESIPVAVPIPHGESKMLVPSSLPIVVLAIRNGQIENATHPIVLQRQEQLTISAFPADAKSTVVALVTLPEDARTPGPHWSRIQPPDAALARGNERIRSEVAVRNGFGTDGALLVFRGVAHGQWTLTIGGEIWRRDELAVDVTKPFTRASRTLVTAPESAVRLRWAAGSPLPTNESCDSEAAPEKPEPMAVRLLTCDGLRPGAELSQVNLSRCKAVRASSLVDAKARTAVFNAVAPGTYLAEVREPGYPLRRAVVSAATAETGTADLVLQSFDFYGRVTLGGEPLRARLQFRTGAAVTDESGHYDAHLADDPGLVPVKVFRCGGKLPIATQVLVKPIEQNQPFDIPLAKNTVRVQVIDAVTKKPIQSADVQCAAMMDKNSDAANFLSQVVPTDVDGNSRIENVPVSYDVAVCAAKAGYNRNCGDRFSMSNASEKSVTLELQPLSGHGMLHASQPIRFGTIFFVNGGVTTETAEISADGAFAFSKQHTAPEYVVVTGANVPLFAMPLPEESRDPIDVTAPASSRDVSVALSEKHSQPDALIGLLLDGLYIPSQVLFLHQARRGDPPLIRKRAPMRITNVSARSIAVILGPSPFDVVPPLTPDDLFTRPERRAATITKIVDVSGVVTFE